MTPELLPQTPCTSVLRRICPSVGPVCRTNWPAGHIERNRRIYDYEFVYFSSGRGRILTEGKNCFCGPGDAVLIPPGIAHCTISDTRTERWCIHFDWYSDCKAHYSKPSIFVYVDEREEFDESQRALPPPEELEIPDLLQRHFSLQEQSTLQPLLQEYFLLSPDGLREEFHRQGVLLSILGYLLDANSSPVRKPEKLNTRFFEAKSRVDMQFANSAFSVSSLARELHLSPNHLTKLFRTKMGLSVHHYLMMRRISSARQLLADTTRSIGEIAECCGFENPNYFARYFRKITGMTPTEFRRENHP